MMVENGYTERILTEFKIDGVRSKKTNPGDVLSENYSDVKFNHFKVDKYGYTVKKEKKRKNDKIEEKYKNKYGRNEPYELPNFKGDDKKWEIKDVIEKL